MGSASSGDMGSRKRPKNSKPDTAQMNERNLSRMDINRKDVIGDGMDYKTLYEQSVVSKLVLIEQTSTEIQRLREVIKDQNPETFKNVLDKIARYQNLDGTEDTLSQLVYCPTVGDRCDVYDKAQDKWVPGEIVDIIDRQYKVKPTDSDQIVVVNSDDIRPFETSKMTEKEKQNAAMEEAAALVASKVAVPQQRVYEVLYDLAKEARDKGMIIAVAVHVE